MTFNFFGLARELRDEIYDHCYFTFYRKDRPNHSVEAIPTPRDGNLRLVKRQFKAKFEDRDRHCHKILTGTLPDALNRGLDVPREVSIWITHLDISFEVLRPNMIFCIACWFLKYTKCFPRLQSVVINLHGDAG